MNQPTHTNEQVFIQLDVVTLSRNSSKVIPATLESVSSQTYCHINHLIIDGGSTDRTLDIIQDFDHGKSLSIVDQQGSGITNAFNIGLSHSTGHLIIFLNSGDVFVDENVVARLVESYRSDRWLWAFGETISRSRRKYLKRHIKHPQRWQQELFLYGNPICHQSAVFSREILEKVGRYDEQLFLEADYDFNVRASLVAPPHLLRFPVAYYDTTGVSSTKVFESYLCHRKLRRKYFSFNPVRNFLLDATCLLKTTKRFLMIPAKQLL
ncbi:glycosyltransferase family 2 protein [Phormidesmis sp. 146-35]